MTSENKGKQFKWWRELTRAEKIQIIGLFLNLLALLAFICISSVQINKTNDALKRSDSSNVYTKRSVELSGKNARIDLKAYINVSSMHFSQFEIGKPIVIDYTIVNVGKTPAYNIRSINTILFSRESNPSLDNSSPDSNDTGITLGAGLSFILAGEPFGVLTKERLKELNDNSLYFFLSSKIVYDDVFGGSDSLTTIAQYNPHRKRLIYYYQH